MFIYNVTIQPLWSIHDNWLRWMQEEHMQEVVNTGCFTHSRLLRLLDVEETDGPTYAAQYFAESRADYSRYLELHAPRLREAAMDKWGERFIAFRSFMEVVQ